MKARSKVGRQVALTLSVALLASCGVEPPRITAAPSAPPDATQAGLTGPTQPIPQQASRRRQLSTSQLAELRAKLARYRTASIEPSVIATGDSGWILEAPQSNEWTIEPSFLGFEFPGAQWFVAHAPKWKNPPLWDAYATNGFVMPQTDEPVQLRLDAKFVGPWFFVGVFGLDSGNWNYAYQSFIQASDGDTGTVTNLTIPQPPPGAYEFDLSVYEEGSSGRTAPMGFAGKLRIGGPGPSEPPTSGLSIEHAAFSPSRAGSSPDGIKDTNQLTIAVAADAAWTLDVDGKGQLDGGTGPKTIPWNGMAPRNPTKILPDGSYTLRLKREGQPDETANVLIDTKKPKVQDVRVTKIQPAGGGPDLEYTIQFAATDVGVAGLAPDTLTVSRANVAIRSVSTATPIGEDRYEIKMVLPPVKIAALDFGVVAKDRAGNQDQKDGNLYLKLESAGLPVKQAETCEASQGYKLQQAVRLPLLDIILQVAGQNCLEPYADDTLNRYVYYLDSGSDFRYYVGLRIRTPNNPVNAPPLVLLPAKINFIKSDDPTRTSWLTQEVLINNVNFANTSEVRWNGLRQNVFGAVQAPQGAYDVVVTYGENITLVVPGIELEQPDQVRRLRPFKVSHHPVIRYQDWHSEPVDQIPLDRSGHILEGHILDPNPSHPRQPNQIFSSYDATFRLGRPAGYDGDTEPSPRPITEVLRQSSPYEDVLRIGRAVRSKARYAFGANGGPNQSAFAFPVALPNDRVVWVRDSHKHPNPSNAAYQPHYTIFPDSTSRNWHESQL